MNEHKLKRLFPNASDHFIKANIDNAQGVCAPVKKPIEGSALERSKPPKKRAARKTTGRLKITYRIFSMHPCDHDNYFTKYITDGLCKSQIIHGDSWHELFGEYISEKACSKDEERTQIEISQINNMN